MELGAEETEAVPFHLLCQHPIIQDCMRMCLRFKAIVSDMQSSYWFAEACPSGGLHVTSSPCGSGMPYSLVNTLQKNDHRFGLVDSTPAN